MTYHQASLGATKTQSTTTSVWRGEVSDGSQREEGRKGERKYGVCWWVGEKASLAAQSLGP